MARKLIFWNARNRKSSTNRRSSAPRARRPSPLRNAALGFEQLESRIVLNAEPVLSIEAGQFFAEDSMTPFRATFTDVREAVNQSFDYTINWGDGEETIGNTTQFRTQLGPFGLLEPAPVGNPISGLIEVGHAYADAGEYTVTVTLTDGLGGLGDTAVTQVNVYPVDAGVIFSGDPNTFEGTPYTISLDPDFFDPQIVENIESYTINWGDSMEVIPGSSTSAVHTYADDDTLHLSPGVHQITVAATGSNGTFFGFGGNVVVEDIDLVSSIDGATDVDEGDTYTLNLSAFDPGDPVLGWLIVWGDEVAPDSLDDFTLLTGNPSSATHVYADGDAFYTIQAIALTDSETHIRSHSLTVHNVDPTADDATFALQENSPNGTAVGNVPATDPGDDALTFTVIGGTGTAAFAVDSATGEITVADGTLLDFETTPTLTLSVEVSDGDGGFDTAEITIYLLKLASINGVVFVDVNENGLYEANEPGIDGVEIQLLDEFGNPVLDEFADAITSITSSGGYFLFEDLDAGIYQLFEVQPTGVNDGSEELGTLGGTIIGNDRMQLTLAGTDAFNYAFAEFGQQLATGDAAGGGFWQNKHGQALITEGGTQLAAWLTSTFPNVFGDTLDGASGSDVATFYREQLFKQKGKKSAGPPKVDANFMAVGLATYFTSLNLAGEVAMAYGFNVTDTGIGTKIVNVGTKGAAFGVADGTDRTILQLLLATNQLTDQPNLRSGYAEIYDTDGDGVINAAEASLRTMADDIYSAINESGGI